MAQPAANRRRLRIRIRGAVQGVGFRPQVYRLATTLGLTGSVCNARDGVQTQLRSSMFSVSWFRPRTCRS